MITTKRLIALVMLLSLISLTGMSKERVKLGDKDTREIIDVLKINEKLHQAFFDYDGRRVEEAAKLLQMSIANISNVEVSKLLTFSKKKLGEIKVNNSRDINNQNYHMVSMALIHLINTYDLGTKYNAYSCPMVKKKWVQNSRKVGKVHNPYAPNMPHCGTQDSHH